MVLNQSINYKAVDNFHFVFAEQKLVTYFLWGVGSRLLEFLCFQCGLIETHISKINWPETSVQRKKIIYRKLIRFSLEDNELDAQNLTHHWFRYALSWWNLQSNWSFFPVSMSIQLLLFQISTGFHQKESNQIISEKNHWSKIKWVIYLFDLSNFGSTFIKLALFVQPNDSRILFFS